MIRVAVVGAAGFVGGELLRILLHHPAVEVAFATSRRFAGRRLHAVHPNLLESSTLTFCEPGDLDACDVVFLAMPHGAAMEMLPKLAPDAGMVIDVSADFRLRDPQEYRRRYGRPHASPELIGDFVPGVPEFHRAALRGADRVAVPGCMATAAMLALHPLGRRGWCEGEVVVDARTGSSGSGAAPAAAGLHAFRSGAMRVFAPAGHRHEAEITQETGLPVRMSATGVEAVRGVQVVCHAAVPAGLTERDLWRAYREQYGREPFVRLVGRRRGPYRLPEPKILSGTNFCDVGLALDGATGRLVVVAALDNLVKGGAGNAVHCLNVRMGWPERLGLEFPGLHPI